MFRSTIQRLFFILVAVGLMHSTAKAQIFRADVYIGPAPPPPVIVYQPAPPPVVVYQPVPPPPPVVIYQPAPQPIVLQQAPAPLPVPEPPHRQSSLGVHGHIGGITSANIHMAGLTGGLRLRKPNSHVGLDLSIGAYAGKDWNGLDRIEIPFTTDAIFYLNPEDTFQVYGLAGLGLSFAHAEGFSSATGNFDDRDYVHLGGEIGAGLEIRLGRHLALNGDIRAFLRHRVDSDGEPEFVDRNTGETTDTSGGAIATLGATFYF